MPSKAKKVDRDIAKLPSIPKELVGLFLTGPMTGEAINAAGIAFKTALIEASVNAELSHHLGYRPGADKPEQVTDHRKGSTSKTVLTGRGGRLCLNSVSLPLSGCSAGCSHGLPLWGVARGGRSPTGVTPHNGGEIHAATSVGRPSK
jgi:hypothetical protein